MKQLLTSVKHLGELFFEELSNHPSKTTEPPDPSHRRKARRCKRGRIIETPHKTSTTFRKDFWVAPKSEQPGSVEGAVYNLDDLQLTDTHRTLETNTLAFAILQQRSGKRGAKQTNCRTGKQNGRLSTRFLD